MIMKFKNNGQDVQVRIKEKSLFGGDGCRWECVRHGEVIELDEGIGLVYGFEMVTEGKINETKVETKQFESDFFNELKNINGIGSKTAQDIVKIFPNSEELKNKIKNNEHLPFRDDVEEKLRRKYGE